MRRVPSLATSRAIAGAVRNAGAAALSLVALLASSLAVVHAQPAATSATQLQVAGEYAHRFTNLTALRELSDKSLLVVDRGENQLQWLASPDATPVQVGRKGEGPSEYKSPGALVALGGDSTLFTDGTLRRWQLLVGRSFRTPAPWSRDIARTATTALLGADQAARVYWTTSLVPPRQRAAPSAIANADSMVLQRMAYVGGRIDTLARLRSKHGTLKMVPRKVMGVESYYGLNDPMRVPDQVAVCQDGWIAVAYTEARRIDWIRADGRRVTGRPLTLPKVKVTEPFKRDAVVRFFSPDVAKYFTPADFPSFPTVVPAFQSKGLHCTYDGRALVERYDLLTKPVVYDVVSRDGTVGAPLQFPPRSKVVGQSGSYIYIVTPDEDDLQILRRYRWR